MKKPNVYAMHEVRMWIQTIIIPGFLATWFISEHTTFGWKVKQKIKKAKTKIKDFFTKKK